MKGAITAAKLNLIPVRRGYWGNKIGDPHTVPTKITGKCGSVRIRLIPAPRGTGVVGAPQKKNYYNLQVFMIAFHNPEVILILWKTF